MIVRCPVCTRRYDDEFRVTYCPHNTFAANTLDGTNRHVHHPGSYLEPDPWQVNGPGGPLPGEIE